MQISLHNYEEFFLLYADGELTQQQKEMVDAFINQHPGLKAELYLLLRTVWPAEKTISFPGKNRLMKEAGVTEEELLIYLDGESGVEAAEKIGRELGKNKNLQQELEWLEKAVVKPDENIVYPGKQALYRSVPVRKMDGWKVAVAASVLFLLGTWLFLYKEDDNKASKVAVADTVMQHLPAKKDAAALTAPAITEAVQDLYKNTSGASKEKDEKPVVVKKGNPATERIIDAQPQVPVVAVNDQPKPATIETASTRREVIKPAVVNAVPKTEGNGDKPDSYEPAVPATPTPQQVAVANTDEKEKKGSFLKKIGRKIGDRALDILTDGEDNIHVAGFAINVRK